MTVQDYPGYAYVLAQVNHGHNACVKCMDETPHLQLPRDPGSSKTMFQGTRKWLCMDHPWRKRGDLFNGKDELERAPRPRSSEEIEELLNNWIDCPTPGKTTEDKAAAGCMESKVCFLGPAILEDPPHSP